MDNFADPHHIDWLTAEFAHDKTEQGFRDYIREGRIRDTRLAIALAGLLYAAFAYTDFLYGYGSEYLNYALWSRAFVLVVGVIGAVMASRQSRWLVNGTIPGVVVVFALLEYMLIVYLIPYDFGNRAMGMMIMLFGVYVFIPNRYIVALLISLATTLSYLTLALYEFGFDPAQYASLVGLLLVTNMMGAMIAHRVSRLMREQYRDHAIVATSNQRLQIEMDERQRLEGVLRHRAEVDDVTGVANRRTFFEYIDRLLPALSEEAMPLSVLLIDVDYFKQINGTYGHLRSDEVLRALVSVCRSLLGNGQYLARLGGEEFVILLPGKQLTEAARLAENIRAECQRTPVAMDDVNVHFTVSVGVIQHHFGDSVNATLRRADDATAMAKYKGRNRVEALPALTA